MSKTAIEWIDEITQVKPKPVVDGIITEVFTSTVTVRLVGQANSRVKRNVKIPEHIRHNELIIGGAVTLTVKQGQPVLVSVYDRTARGQMLPPPKPSVKYSADGQNYVVSWPAVKGAEYYKVFCNTLPTAKNDTSLGQTEDTFFSEPISERKWFAVKSCVGNICSGYSVWVTVSDAPSPTPVNPPGIINVLYLADGDIYSLNDDTWTEKLSNGGVWVEDDWGHTNSSIPNDVHIMVGGLGSIQLSYDGGDTWTDVTPTIAPPNKWNDTPAPTIDDLNFDILRSDRNQEGYWKAIARWQVDGDWRSLILWTDDDGTNWWWADWWLAGGLASDDVIGAYQAVGAYDLNASLINLNEPGVNDLTIYTAPTLSATNGWVSDGTAMLVCDVGGVTPTTIVGYNTASEWKFYFGAAENSAGTPISAVGTPDDGTMDYGVGLHAVCRMSLSATSATNDVLAFYRVPYVSNYRAKFYIRSLGFLSQIAMCSQENTTEYGILAARWNTGGVYKGITGSIQAIAFYAPTTYLTQAQIEAVAAHIQKLKEVYG